VKNVVREEQVQSTEKASEVAHAITALRWVGVAVALAALNASLTFTNVWPTLAIRLSGDVSMKLAVCVLGLVLGRRWLGRRWSGGQG